ncbi:hypothetical protein BD408DRAFT_423672 [Parasitella parasitica]|nr:hypothetical protein BD408DRAFT_423672 [Parasitella parasitica]
MMGRGSKCSINIHMEEMFKLLRQSKSHSWRRTFKDSSMTTWAIPMQYAHVKKDHFIEVPIPLMLT